MAAALEQLLGASLVDGSGKAVAVRSLAGSDKVLGLYFSAHWCPPCRGFTPELAKFYKQMKEKVGDKLEIVFISSDRAEDDWKGYFAEMPWLALPFSARDIKEKLGDKYGVTGIPTLVILDASSGEVISLEGRRLVMTNPDGFPWK